MASIEQERAENKGHWAGNSPQEVLMNARKGVIGRVRTTLPAGRDASLADRMATMLEPTTDCLISCQTDIVSKHETVRLDVTFADNLD